MTKTTHFHLSLAKRYVLKLIREQGPEHVLSNFEGTVDEAIAAVKADPRDSFVVGDCDHVDATGRCLGHRETPHA